LLLSRDLAFTDIAIGCFGGSPGRVMVQGCRRPDRDFGLRSDKLELGNAMARLLIAPNDEIFVAGLKSLLGAAGHDVVSSGNGADGLAMAGSLEPEIIIFSQGSSTAGSLLETIARLQRLGKAPKLVLLLERPADAGEIANLDVDGIVVSGPQVGHLLECIESVAAGRRWVDPDVLSLVFAPKRTSRDSLTSREQQIVDGVVRGLRNKEIAREMNIREGTVKMHLHHIFDKLELKSRTQLVLAFSKTKGTEFRPGASTNPVLSYDANYVRIAGSKFDVGHLRGSASDVYQAVEGGVRHFEEVREDADKSKSSGETRRRQIGRRQHNRRRFNGSTPFDRSG
jgi:two-component system, NarL family, nitrate/nitrite response regulator NarL